MGFYDGYDRCCGIKTALLVVAAILFFAIGIILGAVFSTTILDALATIIAFAAVMLILFVLLLIVRACRVCRCSRTE